MSTLETLTVSRRRFLGLSSSLAGGLLLSRSPWAQALAKDDSFQRTSIPQSAWRRLAGQLTGGLLRPGDRGYPQLALPNNLRYRNIKPGGIALCADARDVATCLRWAIYHGVPLTTRGGGHSYAGYSCTAGLMINLRQFNAAQYDEATGRVTIGGGIRNGSVYRALQIVGRSITHGRCPTVGAGGFLLGGGIGFDMRSNGIASDKLVSTEIVLANGEIVRASQNENPDLFWACRGGAGGNFGINTSFTLDTFPVDRCVEFQLGWDDVSDEFLATLFLNFEQAPVELGAKIRLTPGIPLLGRPVPIHVGVIGQFLGPVAKLYEIIAPINALQAPSNSVIQDMAYWNASAFLSEPGSPEYYQVRSRFINGPVSSGLIAALRDWLPRWNNAQGTCYISFFQTGGATRAFSPTATAFVHRHSEWLASLGISWSPAQSAASRYRAHRWQNRFYETITPLCGGGAFQNFPDPSLNNWAEAYYGENLPRLRAIKTAVDPGNVFRYAQSIRPL